MKIKTSLNFIYSKVGKFAVSLNDVKYAALVSFFALRDAHRKKFQMESQKAISSIKELSSTLLSKKTRSERDSPIYLSHQTFRTTLQRTRYSIDTFRICCILHKYVNLKLVENVEELGTELIHIFGVPALSCYEYDIKHYRLNKSCCFYNKLYDVRTGDMNENDALLFVRIHMSTVERDKSKKVTNQEAGFGVNVQLAFDDDFEDIVKPFKLTFVMFYATWCGHCSTVKPVFSKLATHMRSKEPPVGVVAIDAAENPKVADMAGIQNLPTFKLYESGKFVADYVGDRSYDDMLKFVNTQRR